LAAPLLSATITDGKRDSPVRPIVLFVAIACVAVCAVLALFAAAGSSVGAQPVPRLSRPAVVAGWSLLALALLASLGYAIVSWVRGRRPSGADTGEKPLAVWPLFLISLAALAVLLVGGALFLSLYKPPQMRQDVAPVVQVPEDEEPARPLVEERVPLLLDPATIRTVLLVAAGAAALVLFALAMARAVRASREPGAGSEEVREGLRRELAAALRVSLEEILAEEDYRQAVIACYLRMEQGFGTAGFPRAAAETPLEFLERVMREAGVAGPGVGPALATLTRLYEFARFSEHPVRPADRSEAVSSLRALEGALAGGLRAPVGSRQ
jgi:hypothetical protein